MKLIITAIIAVMAISLQAQNSKVEVLCLGTFHFNFPNLDVVKIEKSDQIDVLSARYQKEIGKIIKRLGRFKPTIIVIERQKSRQSYTDSTFNLYLKEQYELKRDEEEQIGFRIAKNSGINKLYCVDEWGNFNRKINDIVTGADSAGAVKFENYFMNNPDSLKVFSRNSVFKIKGLNAELRKLNSEKNIKKSLGYYLTGLFKYESEEYDFLGVDFETGRWFSRNLKIFRNIQRIPASPSDKILVIYGAGHLNILNHLFECSPEYKIIKAKKYLR